MMIRTLLASFAIALSMSAADAASLVKTYSYFAIGGTTLDDIERQLNSHGPEVKSSGHRHPGATQLQFRTKVGYADRGTSCRIVQANVTVRAKVILPRWQRPKRAEAAVKLIWDTLASDIKRHEESHIVIAKNHARELEKALLAVPVQPNCTVAAATAKAVTTRELAEHDAAQAEFDRVEGINFESRLVRLLRYRIEKIDAARKPS